ncbi:MAG: 2'-5' RNA ligase family protein [Promethearchaeota archaeon]
MNKVYTSAVVIIPPQEKWDSIQEIRKNYDRNIHRWMPHITLIYPFRPENEYLELEKKFSEKCKSIKQFEIALKELSYFTHRKDLFTIWLDPIPNDSIISLQAKILDITPDCNDVSKFKNGYRPHLSLGQIKGKVKLEKIINNLQEEWNEISFLVDKIHFISREQEKLSKFEINKSISLQD